MSTYDTIKTSSDEGFQEATIEVSFVSDKADDALKALNSAYAEARALIESRTRPNAVAEVAAPDPSRPSVVIDNEGDTWKREDGDKYQLQARDGSGNGPLRTLEQIRRIWGTRTEIL